MTLLVLDIKVPTAIPHGQLAHELAATVPDWIAFVITFVLAARYWTLQHQLFNLLVEVKPRTLATTFAFLALVSVLPFTTSLWGHSIREPLAFLFYFAHQAAIGIAILVEIEFGRREHNLRAGEDLHKLRGRLYTMVAAMAAAAAAVWFLPIKFSGIIAAVVAGASRRIRNYLDRRRAAHKSLSQAKSGGA
jgi:uncharacterized membrane protein